MRKIGAGARISERSELKTELISPRLNWSRPKYPDKKIPIKNMLRNGFLGVFPNLKT